jgi:hypothetical protein
MDEGVTFWLNVALTAEVAGAPVAPAAGLVDETLGGGGAAAVVKLHE